jgi:hypothetical protein
MEDRVLIIENQRSEFDIISKFLSNPDGNNKKYQVFPEEKSFSEFMNNIHVVINKDYNEKYVKIAQCYLMKFINDKSIDIILMDFILGGQHCKTGIRLAEVINDERKNNGNGEIPIVFFSKTVSEDKRKTKDEEAYKEKYKLYKWAPKGYFGYEHLDKEYFEKKVIEEGIEKLLAINCMNNTSKLLGKPKI